MQVKQCDRNKPVPDNKTEHTTPQTTLNKKSKEKKEQDGMKIWSALIELVELKSNKYQGKPIFH